MIVIVLILIAVYYIVITDAKVSLTAFRPQWRTLLVSALLTVSVFIYSYYQSNRPPTVNYWKVGWTGYMRALNQEFEEQGSPHRIEIPE